MQSINKAFLLIGGNVGDALLHLRQAVNWLNEDCGKVVKQSAVYETAAWGNINQPSFLNQALELETNLNAAALMPELLQIEEKMGRKRLVKYGPRIIDIDILLFNEEIHVSNDLTIPHPQLQHRLFALIPLAEIAGALIHPILKKTINELVELCTDELRVQKVGGG